MIDVDDKPSVLQRVLRIGEGLSFDGGRIVMTLQERSGRQACIKLILRDGVIVDKPKRHPDPSCNARSLFGSSKDGKN